MADSFIQRVARTLGFDKPKENGAPRVAASVFGKHPAWDDHIPELRAGDARLVAFRQMLYDGITGNVDSGQWDKLQRESQLVPWGHTLLLTGGGGDPVAARAWYSRDGKGRDRYPMVGAVRCGNLPLAWIAREAFPALQSLQTQCESAGSADAVRAVVDAAEEQLLARAGAAAAGPPEFPPEAAARHAMAFLAARPEFGPNHTGLLRVLYHIEREVAPAPKPPLGKPPEIRPISLRVPTCAESSARASEVWSRFLLSRLTMPAPLLVVVPDPAQWVDAIVGPPGVSQIYSLRAPLEVFPFTSEIPYTLDPEFAARTERFIEGCLGPPAAAAPS
ncbi:MAG TPA: hypothetical protein VGI81_12725 [Tepidisphaeraceae bacterium]|jgi:hypothetical protein